VLHILLVVDPTTDVMIESISEPRCRKGKSVVCGAFHSEKTLHAADLLPAHSDHNGFFLREHLATPS
jgi:hypothetical protein